MTDDLGKPPPGVANAWNVTTALIYVDSRIAEADRRLDSRIEEADRRYAERYEASQLALQAALIAQEKAVNTALLSAKEAVNAALIAAKEAVQKAETASEKRFDNVNETISNLSTQQALFMPRSEANVIIGALTARVEALDKEIGGLRESRSEGSGRRLGTDQLIAYALGAVGIAAFLSGHFH